jgi:hypothetical protein
VSTGDEITLSVDLGPGSMNRANVVLLNGAAKDIRPIPLTLGKGDVTVPFGDQTEVVLVMSNASNVMKDCDPDGGQPGDNSCGGTPVDENKTFKYAGVIGTEPATPGGGSVGTGPSVTKFNAAPDPFTPNNDGRKDKTTISFRLSDPAAVTLDLHKGTKRLGTYASSNGTEIKGPQSVTWNGKFGGKKMKEGTYTFKVIAVGDNGTTTKKTTVTLRR